MEKLTDADKKELILKLANLIRAADEGAFRISRSEVDASEPEHGPWVQRAPGPDLHIELRLKSDTFRGILSL